MAYEGAPLRRIDSENAFTAAIFNELADGIESHVAYMLGRGVLEGLELSDEGGFTLGISAGRGSNGLRLIASDDALTQTIPSSVTRYVWITLETIPPAVTLTATSADPGGSVVPLGKVVTDGSGITAVDMAETSGRVELGRYTDLRTFEHGVLKLDLLNGWLGIAKTPAAPLDVEGELRADEITVPAAAISVLEVPQSGSSPATPTDAALVYSKNVGGTAELFVMGEGGVETQITNGGRLRANCFLYRQTSVAGGDTVSNSSAQTNFASKLSIPANSLRVGQVITVEAFGVYGTDAATPGTLNVRLKFGTTVLVASGAITSTAALTARGWHLRAKLVVVSIGATGTVEVQGYAALGTAANAAILADLENTAVVTIDTTTTSDLQISVEMSVADADNSVTQRLLTVESSLD